LIITKNFNYRKKDGNSNLYTPCENIEKTSKTIQERCPDWSISSTKTLHDKNEKMIYHNNAVIRIRNVPVFYTPYFSHPDPSVKRKSGFLPPSIKNFTDLGRTIKTPYFWVINENKDLTFSPIYYFEENPIFLTEYRQKIKITNFTLMLVTLRATKK
jgi:Organic solvent tolerance protein OstA